jgi:integrase
LVVHDEQIEKVPIFPKIKVQEPEWKWIDVEVQGNILLAIPEPDRYLYILLALHGCRPSEARALKVKDITFHGEIPSVTIRRTYTGKSGNVLVEETKTKRHRVIPVNPEVQTS